MRSFIVAACLLLIINVASAQHSDETKNLKELSIYQDSLKALGKTFINNPDELERKNANYKFIRFLVSALKVPHSFNYSFDSVKAISIINAPDSRFRIMSWHVMNQDGSYRFYGTVQMNTGEKLVMYPLEDYSPMLKNPEDSVTDNHKWYGAQYYKIVRVAVARPYYILLGWKGNNVRSTRKVIEVLSFDRNNKPSFGMPVFGGTVKNRKRIVFEYTRQASMLLRYVPEQDLIVFDHLSPPDQKLKDKPETFGPDLSYDGFKLKNGKWELIENLDMRNIPEARDAAYADPKAQARIDRSAVPLRKKN
jgi:hypothetical protein